jgi:hypothetical protein
VSDAIITGIVAILVCIINNWVQYNKTRQETDKTVALIKVKLDELSDRVDKHNQLVERTYHLESETALLNERLKIMEGKSA